MLVLSFISYSNSFAKLLKSFHIFPISSYIPPSYILYLISIPKTENVTSALYFKSCFLGILFSWQHLPMSTIRTSYTSNDIVLFQLFGIPVNAILGKTTGFCQFFIGDMWVIFYQPNDFLRSFFSFLRSCSRSTFRSSFRSLLVGINNLPVSTITTSYIFYMREFANMSLNGF